MGRDVQVSPIFFCLEIPGQDQVNARKPPSQQKLNGFLRFAPFRIACKAFVPKVECLSTLEIECFFRSQQKLNAICSWWQNWMQNWMLDLCRTHVDLSMYHLLHCHSTPVLHELSSSWCRKLNVIPCSRFECLSSVAYSHLPLLGFRHLRDLANPKSYVLFVIVLFSKLH